MGIHLGSPRCIQFVDRADVVHHTCDPSQCAVPAFAADIVNTKLLAADEAGISEDQADASFQSTVDKGLMFVDEEQGYAMPTLLGLWLNHNYCSN